MIPNNMPREGGVAPLLDNVMRQKEWVRSAGAIQRERPRYRAVFCQASLCPTQIPHLKSVVQLIAWVLDVLGPEPHVHLRLR